MSVLSCEGGQASPQFKTYLLEIIKDLITLPNFRYFSSRGIDSINNHFITYILLDKCTPVGYCHLDYMDECVGGCWLGIAVIEPMQGRGLGRYLIKRAINYAQSDVRIHTIFLRVDRSNAPAKSLYSRMNFKVHPSSIDEQENESVLMSLNLNDLARS